MNDQDTVIELKDVNKYFGSNHVIHNLNIQIYRGEFITILGSSGCGKTTILRMIGGFEKPSDGSVFIDGTQVNALAPYKRNVNTVFQNYALFPHMTVYDNIAYGLKIKKVNRKEICGRVMKMLELVQLSGFEKRQISQLSGGQKQRVAIARALVNRPKVLLLDEPLSALDLQLRKQMQVELKRLQRKLRITFVYVTHDQEEALTMSDRIAVMNNGYLEQLEAPKTIYNAPKTKFVANFIGETNSFDAQVGSVDGEIARVLFEMGGGIVKSAGLKAGEIVYISVRPEKMRFSQTPVEGFSLCAVTKEIMFVGSVYKSILLLKNGQEIKLNAQLEENVPRVGESVYLYWDINDAVSIVSKDNKVYDLINNIDLREEKKVKLDG